ncbi:MAG: type VI secretion system baseplate subunit TssF [Gemmataceae bacterium]
MSDQLFRYYEEELRFIRHMAQDFARRYPAAAGRLLLEPERSADPHVERMIEAFALLAARIRHKIEDDFPELTQNFLQVVYPHYLAPIPSMAIVQLVPDPIRVQLPGGIVVQAGSQLHTQPVGNPGLPCRFRTGYAVTLWPVVLTQARLQGPPFPSGLPVPPRTAGLVRLVLEARGGLHWFDLQIATLRVFLAGEPGVTAALYELLFNHVTRVLIRSPEKDADLPLLQLTPEEALRPVGFEPDEGLVPYPSHAFPGYRLLSELFAFPAKFQFFDLCGLERIRQAGYREKVEVIFCLDKSQPRLEPVVDANHFHLYCTPVVNLFSQLAEPITLDQRRYEYRIVPDVAHPRGTEVYSIEEVSSVDAGRNVVRVYEPFYSFRHGRRLEDALYWCATRRPSTAAEDQGTEVYLALVDRNLQPRLPAEEVLMVQVLCTNRDLPTQLQRLGDESLVYFELEAAVPLERIRCLRAPTAPLRPPSRPQWQWRLISHLALNHLSLTDDLAGRDALREILRLYNYAEPGVTPHLAAINEQMIEGILAVRHRRVVGQMRHEQGLVFCRGVAIELELDEDKYALTGPLLFGAVLERFFAQYASLNSFTQLVVRTAQKEGVYHSWPPRAGQQVLL